MLCVFVSALTRKSASDSSQRASLAAEPAFVAPNSADARASSGSRVRRRYPGMARKDETLPKLRSNDRKRIFLGGSPGDVTSTDNVVSKSKSTAKSHSRRSSISQSNNKDTISGVTPVGTDASKCGRQLARSNRGRIKCRAAGKGKGQGRGSRNPKGTGKASDREGDDTNNTNNTNNRSDIKDKEVEWGVMEAELEVSALRAVCQNFLDFSSSSSSSSSSRSGNNSS